MDNNLDRITELENKVYELTKQLDTYERALNTIAARKPANPLNTKDLACADINGYIKAIANYITELSNTDNIIISAVYEKLKQNM